MTTEERLDVLERELARAKRRNRWLVAVGLLAAGLLAAAWLATETADTALAQVAKPAQVIRATAFVLVDDKGRERGKLAMTGEGPRLDLLDENAKVRAALTALKDKRNSSGSPDDRSELALSDENGKTRALLAASKRGTVLVVYDENGKHRAALGVGGATTPDWKSINMGSGSDLRLFGPDGKLQRRAR